jgi:hypothetical protein
MQIEPILALTALRVDRRTNEHDAGGDIFQ